MAKKKAKSKKKKAPKKKPEDDKEQPEVEGRRSNMMTFTMFDGKQAHTVSVPIYLEDETGPLAALIASSLKELGDQQLRATGKRLLFVQPHEVSQGACRTCGTKAIFDKTCGLWRGENGKAWCSARIKRQPAA